MVTRAVLPDPISSRASARRSRAWLGLALGAMALLGACADTGGSGEVAKQRFMTFQFEVYPTLLRDCAFPACHGAEDRFLRVYGPGRVRLDPESGALDQPQLSEVTLAHRLSQSMIDIDDLEASPLLTKPLAVAAGGAGHKGVDGFDRDVYRTKQDHGYTVLRRWVYSLQAELEAQQQEQQMQSQQQTLPP